MSTVVLDSLEVVLWQPEVYLLPLVRSLFVLFVAVVFALICSLVLCRDILYDRNSYRNKSELKKYESWIRLSSKIPIFVYGYIAIVLFSDTGFASVIDSEHSFGLYIASVCLIAGGGLLAETIQLVGEEFKQFVDLQHVRFARSQGMKLSQVLFKPLIRPIGLMLVDRLNATLPALMVLEYQLNIDGIGNKIFGAVDSSNFVEVAIIVILWGGTHLLLKIMVYLCFLKGSIYE